MIKMKSINKIDADNLEITETVETKRIMPKADIERNIANLEKDLVMWRGMLAQFD